MLGMKVVSQAKLDEYLRLAKLEMWVEGHGAECLEVRKENKEEITSLKQQMDENHREWKTLVSAMDKSNIAKLDKINKVLIGVLVSLLGFLGVQIWSHTVDREYSWTINQHHHSVIQSTPPEQPPD